LQQGIVAFAFGLVFIGVMLYIALKVPNPTDSQWFTFRVILALAVGGVGAVLPGALDVTVAPSIRAGGALALVVLVFWFNPPKLVAGKDQGKDQPKPDDPRPQGTEDAETLDCKQRSSIRSQDGGDKMTPPEILVGSKIQWASQGADQFPNGGTVLAISDDGQWVFTDQGASAVPTSEVIVMGQVTPAPAPNPPSRPWAPSSTRQHGRSLRPR